MILIAAIGWLDQTVTAEEQCILLWQTVEVARHVGLDKLDLLMEVRRPGAAFKTWSLMTRHRSRISNRPSLESYLL